MLIWFVVLYLLVSIGIGLFAATRVHSAKDFAIAGRHLPLPVVTATVFATWFGAETVMGIPAKFVQGGLNAIVEDPFGAGQGALNVQIGVVQAFHRIVEHDQRPQQVGSIGFHHQSDAAIVE